MFAAGESSDQPRAVLLAELVREAVIRRTFQEVPHAVEVVVEEVEYPRAGTGAGAGADLGRERLPEGDRGRRRRAHDQGDRHGRAPRAGARAGCQVHLDLSVRVRRDWRADEGLLDRLGIT